MGESDLSHLSPHENTIRGTRLQMASTVSEALPRLTLGSRLGMYLTQKVPRLPTGKVRPSAPLFADFKL